MRPWNGWKMNERQNAMTEYKHARLQRHARTMLALSAALLILFAALIVAIKTVDVQNVGPNGSQIGLATLNLRVHQRTGLQMGWYDITDKLGKICILIAPCFALLGLYQLIRRRSLKRVDADLWALAGLYVALGAAYVLFEKVIINYRPVILPTETALEASFPSSHAMLAVCLVSSALVQAERRIGNQKVLFLLDVLGVLMMLVMSVGRLASGVHWLTDVLGGVLLGAALTAAYAGVVARLDAAKAAKAD